VTWEDQWADPIADVRARYNVRVVVRRWLD
jgi:ubiquinone biosynthesis protein Coq4